MEKIYEILGKLLNQKDEKMYDLVWVGRNYSKKDLINDLEEVKEEMNYLEQAKEDLEKSFL